jgi:nitrogenase molybdenum-iron protein alpha/beta subunit
LTPLVVPDISTALDGHAGDRAVIDGGVATSQMEQMAECSAYLALGNQMSDAAGELSLVGMPGLTLSAWTGMRQTDEILNRLVAISGQPIPKGTSKNPSNKNLHLVLHVHPMNEAFLHGAPDEAGRIF